MKILFCSAHPLNSILGAAKVLLELPAALRTLGWTCDVARPSEMGHPDEGEKGIAYSQALRRYLHDHAASYDVVEYDHGHLPYARSEFPAATLMVARSQLLSHHFLAIVYPRGWKEKLSYWRRGTTWRRESTTNRDFAHITLQQADLITLSNDDDAQELVKNGIPRDKMVVIPYGLDPARRALFDAIPSAPPSEPVIAFTGTFDSRKGAQDFPVIVQQILTANPAARFRLLGTGPGRDAAYVHAYFPRSCRDRIEVRSEFSPEELPRLLADCAVGIFPSYIESFGFGVLEMLAASIPVVAYRSPGPTILLPTEYLVDRGDTKAMVQKVLHLLSDRSELTRARNWAKRKSQEFTWAEAGRKTSDAYRAAIEKKHRAAETMAAR